MLSTNVSRDSFCNFALPMLRFCPTYFANLCDPCCDWFCDFARPMLRLCATHVATLRDPCCYFARPMLRFCANHVATLCNWSLLKFRSQKIFFGGPNSVATWAGDLGPGRSSKLSWKANRFGPLFLGEKFQFLCDIFTQSDLELICAIWVCLGKNAHILCSFTILVVGTKKELV